MHLARFARPTRLRVIIMAAILVVAGLLSASQLAAAGVTSPDATAWHHGPRPAIVLEHGAWADGSSWAGEIKRLQRRGFTVYAPPNPLRGLANDSATLADFLSTIPGPVILVGHSYGGMVITNAATNDPNVKALVYVDAFIPARGETAFGLTAARPGSCLGSANAFNAVPYPGAPKGDFDAYLKAGPDLPYPGFAQCFANGLPASQAAVLAATQRPIAFSAGSDPLRRSGLADDPVLVADRHRRPRDPAGRAALHVPARQGSHHRDQRRAPVPDLPPGRGHPHHHPGGARHQLTLGGLPAPGRVPRIHSSTGLRPRQALSARQWAAEVAVGRPGGHSQLVQMLAAARSWARQVVSPRCLSYAARPASSVRGPRSH